MLKSHSIIYSDFRSEWYKNWAKKLRQTPAGRGKFALRANKFWQNAVMTQALFERGALASGKQGIGFGVGKERLPTLFASLGVQVTATDQDFTKTKAKQWNNEQLAHGAFSLNEDNICAPALFNKNVTFMSLDMNRIPAKVCGKYDFLWSNCALGHLGSIDKGLGFIEASLQCLKPGGWAVHTTEINVVSNDQTADSGSTVIFRLKDIYGLCRKLTDQGFLCSPFYLSNGTDALDRTISLDPAWGTDHTKILVAGHVATQALLIVCRPAQPLLPHQKFLERLKHKRAYQENLRTLQKIADTNEHIRLLKSTQHLVLADYKLTPLRRKFKITPTTHKIIVSYTNNSEHVLTGINSLFDAKPLVLGTDNPVNHPSPLANNDWFAPNRPGVRLHKKTTTGWQATDYTKPGEVFSYVINISPKKTSKSRSENFSIIQEGGGIVADTQVTIQAG
jgi:hypothetical protein